MSAPFEPGIDDWLEAAYEQRFEADDEDFTQWHECEEAMGE